MLPSIKGMAKFLLLVVLLWLVAVTSLPQMERRLWSFSTTHSFAIFDRIFASRIEFGRYGSVAAAGCVAGMFVLFPMMRAVDPQVMQRGEWKGTCYSVFLAAHRDFNATMRMFDKLYWAQVFDTCGIKTPTIQGVIVNGQFRSRNLSLDVTQRYIFKPVRCSQGSNITFETVAKFLRRGYTQPFLVQDRVYDGEQPDFAIHYRFLSICERGQAYGWILSEVRSDHESIISNTQKGSKKYVCPGMQCAGMSYTRSRYLDDLKTQLIKLHETQFSFSPTIGWDFIISKDGCYVLEGNVDSGVLGPDDDPAHACYMREYDVIMRRIYAE